MNADGHTDANPAAIAAAITTPPPHATAPSEPRLGPFMTLWSGQALSLFGSAAVQFALIWWLTIQTGSAAVLTAATFVGLLPQIALGPFIGALVDRWSRRTVMLLSDAAVAAASLALAVMFAQGTATVPAVFAILFARALGSAFHAPAMLAATALMVPQRHFTRIQGLNQALQGALAIVGAPAGALLYASLSMAGVMLVDAVTALFAITPLFFVRVPEPGTPAGGKAAPAAAGVLEETLAGFRYLRSRRGHMALVMIAACINLFIAPAFALLPLLVQHDLGGGAMTLGWMTSLFGAGMIAGGTVLGAWGGFSRRIATSLAGILGLGAAVLVLGLAPAEPLAIAAAALLGVGLMVPFCNGPIFAIMQATIDPAYQGRVFALLGSLAAGTAPLGLLLAAPIAGVAGVRAWFLAGGFICLAMGIVGFLTPALMRIEEPRDSSFPDMRAGGPRTRISPIPTRRVVPSEEPWNDVDEEDLHDRHAGEDHGVADVRPSPGSGFATSPVQTSARRPSFRPLRRRLHRRTHQV